MGLTNFGLRANRIKAKSSLQLPCDRQMAGLVGVLLMLLFSNVHGAAVSAAVLPDSRSAVVGETVTIFATIAAAGDATGCSIAPLGTLPITFAYQTTNPTTNAVTGSPNVPVDIVDGGSQSFVLSFTANGEFEPTAITFDFSCDNAPAAPVSSVNTLTLSGNTAPTADVIAIASVVSNDGTLSLLADNNSAAFAVAAINVGESGDVMVDAEPGSQRGELAVFGCGTDALGQCIEPPAPAALPLTVNLGATAATFSFFVSTQDWIRFKPDQHRLRVTFSDGSGVNRGATSVAVTSSVVDGLDMLLVDLILENGLEGDPAAGRNLPNIADPLPQLGKLLFFSKSLGGDQTTACASCHHPALGGGDGLSLSVGTGAINPDVMGPGREHESGLPIMGRNAQTVFNTGLYDKGLFWDSRIESLTGTAGQNGANGGISTPDSGNGNADAGAGPNLLAAQARFPVVAPEEMTADFANGQSASAIRDHLAARIGNFGSGAGVLDPNDWLTHFRAAFNSTGTAEQLITFTNISIALAEYQRSMVFTNNPWRHYVEGDLDAISVTAKNGARQFWGSEDDFLSGCGRCHSGDFLTDEEHHVIASPQIGPGKGDGNGDDFGRNRVTNVADDRYRFRTPSLLNIDVTAPYFHSGSYNRLDQVLAHYAIPLDETDDFFNFGTWCSLPQFSGVANCQSLFPSAESNTRAALDVVFAKQQSDPDSTFPDISALPPTAGGVVVEFLKTLTDPCVTDRQCLAPWIPTPDEAPDANQLNAQDINGTPL